MQIKKRLLTLLIISLAAMSTFAQGKKDKEREDSKSEGLKKISSQRDRNYDNIIDEDELEANIERSIEHAMKSVEVSLEKLELHLKSMETNLKNIDIEPIHIQIPEINIEPIKIDLKEIDRQINHQMRHNFH